MLAVPTSGREHGTPRMPSFQYVYVQTKPFPPDRFVPYIMYVLKKLRLDQCYILNSHTFRIVSFCAIHYVLKIPKSHCVHRHMSV